MSKFLRTGLWLTLAVALAICFSVLFFSTSDSSSGFNIQSNILDLLPDDQNNELQERAFDSFSERSMRRLIFLVENASKQEAINSAQTLAGNLSASPYIQELVLQVSDETQKASSVFAYEFRHHLLSDEDRTLLEQENYIAFSDETIRTLFGPISGGLGELVQTDPFLLSYRFALANNPSTSSSLKLEDSYLIAEQDEIFYVLINVTLARNPFDPALQEDLVTRIRHTENLWHSNGSNSNLLRTGTMFYADHAFQTARHEVTFIGGSSLLLVLALIILAFHSLRPILLVALALAFGVGLGFVLVRLVFGEVHVLTIVFGASLIGVAVDYAFHYFVQDAGQSGTQRLKGIFPAISLGLASSLIGYAALATTPFPGLRQMALFCIAGLIGAWLTVVLLFPALALHHQCSARLLSVCQILLAVAGKPAARSLFFISLVLPVAALAVIYMRTPVSDDVRLFQAETPDLAAQESRVSEILKAPAATQFYLARGDSPQDLLEHLEDAGHTLSRMKAEGLIDDYLSLSPWLPSVKSQARDYELYEKLYQSEAMTALEEQGLIDETVRQNVLLNFSRDQNYFLTPELWQTSAVGAQYEYLWLGQIGNDFAAVIPLRGINNLEALEDLNRNTLFTDKVATVNALINSYRKNAGVLLLAAFSAVFILLFFRYGLQRSALVLVSPLVALSVAIVGLQLMGEGLSLFNTLALFLVLGIGVDFGIFFIEAKKVKPQTLMAIMLSALTTMFSFGLLALSETPVIHSFGITMLLGISTAFILSPVAGQLLLHKDVKIHE